MSSTIPKEMMEATVRFHGHLGPFLVLGLKAGLCANQLLGKDYFKTNVVVETEVTPPCSCFVDGVQFATGCTMGKGNIQLKEDDSLSAIFTKGDKKLELFLKDDILKKLKDGIPKSELEKIAVDFSKKDVRALFHLKY